jgi:hypothetical protein
VTLAPSTRKPLARYGAMKGALASGSLHIGKNKGVKSSCRRVVDSGCRLTGGFGVPAAARLYPNSLAIGEPGTKFFSAQPASTNTRATAKQNPARKLPLNTVSNDHTTPPDSFRPSAKHNTALWLNHRKLDQVCSCICGQNGRLFLNSLEDRDISQYFGGPWRAM